MNNEWLNNLRSRMDDHEEDVPEGLWDDIKDELFSGEQDSAISGLITEIQEDITIKEKETYAGKKSLFYRTAGIAAAIVLLFLLIKLIPQEVSEKRISQKSPAVEIGKERNSLKPIKTGDHSSGELKSERDAFLADNILNTGSAEKIAAQRYAESRSENQAEKSQKIQNVFKLAEAAESFQQESRIAYNIPSVDDTAKENDKEKASDEVIFEQENPKEIYAENTKRNTAKSRNKKSWMLSMLTGNIASNSAEQQFPGYASITGKAMSVEQVFTTSEYHDDPLTAILLANQSQPVEARIRHKVPVNFGLSLYYNLGKRWGIGTGLNYTKLASELHSGSDNNYIKGDQTIHYIGLPVQVNYNVIRKGRFTGYITGGALVEKPISGSVTTSYIVNDEVKESSKERLDHKPFQFSVNAAAGLQLKIVDKIGVYAEPGIGYHFKEENAPNTIYKEKPLHFNMKFGIRVLLD